MAQAKARKATPAQARKAAAIDAYAKAFGRAPLRKLSAAEIERRLPRPSPTQRIAESARATSPVASARRPAYQPLQHSITKQLPTGYYGRYLDARMGTRETKWQPDRKAAAQVLRDYRSSLGRDRPSSFANAKGFAQKAEVVVRETAKQVGKRQIFSSPHWAFGLGAGFAGASAASSGFMFDGVRGMARGIVSTATFGLATPVFNAAFGDGKDSMKHVGDALFPLNNAEVAQKKVADAVNERPTRKAAEYLHKTAGAPKPVEVKDVTLPKRLAPELGALGAGAAGALATPYLMSKIGEGVVKGATAVARHAPAIGNTIARVAAAAPRGPAGMAVAVGIAAAGAIASSGSAKAAPAADTSSKTRTDPYVTKDGRQYRNGRLIVRSSI